MRTDAAQSRTAPAAPRRSVVPNPARRLALARAVVTWERLWPALWPAAAIAAAFVGVALLDVLPLLPEGLHGILLIAVAAALVWRARRGWRRGLWANAAAARARIERDSGLDHRPLTAIEDRLAFGESDPAARALWEAHRQAAAAQAEGLRVRPPAPGLAARDPRAFRAAALLLLVVGLIAGHGDAGRRLVRALNPGIAATDASALSLEAWITPPAYTRRAPIFLGRDGDAAEAPLVPVGSAVLVQAGGAVRGLRLKVGDVRVPFAPVAAEGAAAPAVAPSGGRAVLRAEATVEAEETDSVAALVVEAGNAEIHRWPIRLVADAPPEVALTAAPSAASGARLRLDFEALDDYGVVSVVAVIRRPSAETDEDEELRVPLQTGAPGPRVRGTSLHDLSAHPWAGVPVVIHLEATDAAGQVGIGDAVPGRLPERFFNHPVARALADIRRRLVDPSPETIEDAVMELERLSGRPQHFSHDTVVYLALRIAIGRLAHDGGTRAVAEVRTILWETALRIEDGKFAVAGRDLRDLQERLARALREGRADQAEAERLLDEIKNALDKLFEALAREMDADGAEPVPFDPETMQVIDQSDLYRMIEEARELMRMGAMDAARQMLADLQRMLEGLKRGLAAMPRQGEGQKAARAMRDLRELAQRQQQLLDRTFRRARSGEGRQDNAQGSRKSGKGRPGSGEAIDDARAQNALRRLLGQMMTQMDEMLGKIPDSLGGAERAMREAEDALRQGDAGGAIGPQSEAVEKLREAVQGIGEQLARRMGGFGAVGEMPGGTPGPNRDPFGRETTGATGAASGGEVRVPDRGERLRAREILDELRRRAGERNRPALERDYIDRLLRMF